jgi:hypothetical protein
VAVDGVVDALRTLEEALVPGGRLVDTQPLSPRPSIFSAHERLGSLNMREWARKIKAVDEQVDRALAIRLFDLEHEQRFIVTDAFDDGDESVEIVSEWGGTRVSRSLATRIRRATPPITVDEEIRLRLFSKLG